MIYFSEITYKDNLPIFVAVNTLEKNAASTTVKFSN